MLKKLEEYNFPGDLKSMDEEELDLLCVSIREFLLEKVSRTGGHIASNLGIVEIAVAMHRVFDSPRDKFIWDVGHQSYVHKILTGRISGFDDLRQFGGMSGFPKSCESEHDVYETGHSSTSLSAAYGMAVARDLKGENHEVVAVIGDGSLTGGMAYEALNNIGASGSKVIVILNDNGMSISKNIGGMSDHLNNLRASAKYIDTKRAVKDKLSRIPKIGGSITSGISTAKEKVRNVLLAEGVIFDELGFNYLGPVDGHDLESVIDALKYSKMIDGPVVLHMITKKGKGYKNAETKPDKFHGIAPFDIETGEPLEKTGRSWSKAMGEKLTSMAEDNDNIAAITAAMGPATGLGEFQKRFPDRYFDVGIAEAHAVTFAAGLARSGIRPFVAIYSSFLQRAYDQIVEDVCLQNLPVVFVIDRAGLVGADGETHHGLLDISYLSSIPNMTLLAPSNEEQLDDMMDEALRSEGPVAIRYPRGACPSEEGAAGYEGHNIRLRAGSHCDILAVGTMTQTALDASDILKGQGIDAGVVDVTRLMPVLDEDVSDLSDLIFTLEDGYVKGGYGMELKAFAEGKDVIPLGLPSSFIEHGSVSELRRKYDLDPSGVAAAVKERIERKN